MASINLRKLNITYITLSLIAGFGLTSTAGADNHKRYAIDTAGDVVTNSAKECWITRGGIREKLEMCGDAMMKPEGDADRDGVKDSKDRCPNTPRGATVDEHGCPLDTDGDGVADYLDVCPDTPKGAKVDSKGCEVKAMKPMQPKMEKVVIENILLFEFDSADLKGGAKEVLDSAYAKFKDNDAVKSVMITGHTDSTGSEDYNQGLSERRANTVRDYLLSQGADSRKLMVRGAGEKEPAFTNDTAEGRSLNRRVEFDVRMK